MKEKAILIGLITPDLKAEQVYEYLDELPRNAAGKLLKRELRERFDDVTE